MRKQEQPQEDQYDFPHVTDPSLDPGTGILTTYIEGQDAPIEINGPVDTIAELAEAAYKADMAREKRQTNKLASVATKAVTEPVRSPQDGIEVLTGRRATIKAKLYDLANGTNMYELLLQKRQEERDLAMAKRLGLITAERCQKHEKQLASVRGML